MLRHCAADPVGDIPIDVDADAAANVVGLEACEGAVAQEIFFTVQSNLAALKMSENSEGAYCRQLNLLWCGKNHFRAQTPDKVEREKNDNQDFLIYTKATAQRFNAR